jgi:hypothetical protein
MRFRHNGTDEFSAAIPRAATGHSPERNGTTMSTKRENRPSWLDYNTKSTTSLLRRSNGFRIQGKRGSDPFDKTTHG